MGPEPAAPSLGRDMHREVNLNWRAGNIVQLLECCKLGCNMNKKSLLEGREARGTSTRRCCFG